MYNIISTGSKGNAIILDNRILLDCGVAYKLISGYINKISLILLTHIHQDHFRRTTIKKIALEHPIIRFVCASWLVKDLLACGVRMENIDVLEMNGKYLYSSINISIEAFFARHNVENCGYKIILDNKKIFFATDLCDLVGIEAPNYDLYLIEANYVQEEIEQRIREKIKKGEFCYEIDVLYNHLSKEKSDEWLFTNMGNQSKIVYLHQHV